MTTIVSVINFVVFRKKAIIDSKSISFLMTYFVTFIYNHSPFSLGKIEKKMTTLSFGQTDKRIKRREEI